MVSLDLKAVLRKEQEKRSIGRQAILNKAAQVDAAGDEALAAVTNGSIDGTSQIWPIRHERQSGECSKVCQKIAAISTAGG
eukprot:scaffold39826_cov46-Prasinocladus_malaysianus.AAC.2